MAESLLQIRNLSASYDESFVLKGIDLTVYKGEILCIVGESGSGKSTLIKAICSDKSVRVTEGDILFREKRCGYELLGSSIGLVQQNPEGAFNPLRAFDVQFKETLKSHKRELDKKKLSGIFTTLGLKDAEKLLKMRPFEMSGGMNQRMAIAASLILEPELLLCDEITSALDVSTAIAAVDELLRLRSELGVTIVFVTHNLGIAANIADRVAIMYQGKIVEIGDAGDVLRNPKHDYTKGLLRDVPKLKLS